MEPITAPYYPTTPPATGSYRRPEARKRFSLAGQPTMMRNAMNRSSFVLFFVTGCATAVPASTPSASTGAANADRPAPGSPPPAARAADVESIDAIIAAIYGIISGPSQKPRDWTRFRSLFVPDARLMPTGTGATGGRLRSLTVEEYISNFDRFLAKDPDGFFESEVARKVDRFDRIAHVFSTYEARKAPDREPFARGINSIQLFHDDQRWWVVTIYWAAERPEAEIPPRYR